MEIRTSTGKITTNMFAGLKKSGMGYAITDDDNVLEIAARDDGTWHAVKQVDPSTLPKPATELLNAQWHSNLMRAHQNWAVAHRGYVYVVVTFGSAPKTRERFLTDSKWKNAFRPDGSTKIRGAALALANALHGQGSCSCARVVLVPASAVADADIADATWIVSST